MEINESLNEMTHVKAEEDEGNKDDEAQIEHSEMWMFIAHIDYILFGLTLILYRILLHIYKLHYLRLHSIIRLPPILCVTFYLCLFQHTVLFSFEHETKVY